MMIGITLQRIQKLVISIVLKVKKKIIGDNNNNFNNPDRNIKDKKIKILGINQRNRNKKISLLRIKNHFKLNNQ